MSFRPSGISMAPRADSIVFRVRGMDGKDHGERTRETGERLHDSREDAALVDVGRPVQRDERVPAGRGAELVENAGTFRLRSR